MQQNITVKTPEFGVIIRYFGEKRLYFSRNGEVGVIFCCTILQVSEKKVELVFAFAFFIFYFFSICNKMLQQNITPSDIVTVPGC